MEHWYPGLAAARNRNNCCPAINFQAYKKIGLFHFTGAAFFIYALHRICLEWRLWQHPLFVRGYLFLHGMERAFCF